MFVFVEESDEKEWKEENDMVFSIMKEFTNITYLLQKKSEIRSEQIEIHLFMQHGLRVYLGIRKYGYSRDMME